MGEEGDVVLVTGGSGFLGQHIVQHLCADPATKEIRILDLRPFVNQLGFKESKPIRGFVGDVNNAETLEEVFKGVSCVIHSAAATGFRNQPRLSEAERVNVEGTRSIIHACLKFNVPQLVFTSTVDVCIPKRGPVFQAKEPECTPLSPHQLLLPALAGSKLKAERLVKEANGRTLTEGGKRLKTVILRLTLLYGELDPYFVTESLQIARDCGGILYRVGHEFAQRFQTTYVGNAAYAHVQAKNTLKTEDVGGNFFFITDDTPLDCHFSFLEPFLKDRGFQLSKTWLPYYVTFLLLMFLQIVSRLLRPLFTLRIPFPPAAILHYICSVYSFSRFRADMILGYKPLFAFDTAFAKSRRYYGQVSLDGRVTNNNHDNT